VVTPGRRREHAQHVSSLKIYFRSRLTAVASRILKSLIIWPTRSLSLFNILSSLGPGSAVEEKDKKNRTNRKNVGEQSKPRRRAGKGGWAWRHAFDATVPWYQIISCSYWWNVLMLTDLRCCTAPCSFNITLLQFGKRFLKHGFRATQANFE